MPRTSWSSSPERRTPSFPTRPEVAGVRAVVFEDVGKVRVAEVPDPTIEEPRDALIRVARSAICGSDLHFFHGKAPLSPGEVMGHEAVGVVEALGPEVTRFAPGRSEE